TCGTGLWKSAGSRICRPQKAGGAAGASQRFHPPKLQRSLYPGGRNLDLHALGAADIVHGGDHSRFSPGKPSPGPSSRSSHHRRGRARIPARQLLGTDKAADLNVAIGLEPAVHVLFHGTAKSQSGVNVLHFFLLRIDRNPCSDAYARGLIVGLPDHHVIALVGSLAVVKFINGEGQLEEIFRSRVSYFAGVLFGLVPRWLVGCALWRLLREKG